jgi:hypothetical protein
MPATDLKPGDWVIYRMQKSSVSPGPRAREVWAAEGGDEYYYVVDKYWIVQEVLADGRIRLRTRRGKEHVVGSRDPRLRRPRWWERWLLGSRFRAVEQGADAPNQRPS